MTRYAIHLQWIEDAEAKRLASMTLDRIPSLDHTDNDPVSGETQSWLMAISARVALGRFQLSSVKANLVAVIT